MVDFLLLFFAVCCFLLFVVFLWRFFRLAFFVFLVKNFVDFVADIQDDEEGDQKQTKNNNKTNKTDYLSRDKNKEVFVDVERIKKYENTEQDLTKTRVVGVKVVVLGKFTQMIANKMGLNLNNINQETLLNKGYHQAMLELSRGSGRERGQGGVNV